MSTYWVRKFPLKESVILVASALSSMVYAEESNPEIENITIVGSQHGYQADNVSAMKMEMSQLDTPGSVAVFDETLIQEQGAQTLGDVLKNDASISAGNTRRNRERFYMRGFEMEPDQSYLRNGQFHLANYMLPMELYERVEVLKGPSSLLYGKSTPAGMINLVTKKPQNDFHLNLAQELGAYNHTKTTIDVGGALNDTESVRARFIGSTSSKESYRRHKDGSALEIERMVGAVIVEADLSDRGVMRFNYDRIEDKGHIDMGSAFFYDGTIIGTKDFVWDMPWAKRDNFVENYGVELEFALTDSWEVNAGYNHQNVDRRTIESNWGKIYNESSNTPNYNPSTGDWTVMAQDTFDRSRVDTGYLDFKGKFALLGVQHNMLVGASYIDYRKSDQQYSKGTIGKLNINDNVIISKPSDLDYRRGDLSEFERQTLGIYLQDYIEFNDQWHALVGIRFDQEKSSNEKHSNVLPKLAVIYHPSYDSSIYATYSQSFEPKDPIAAKYANAGTKLDAERGELYELGAKKEYFNGNMLVSGALFNIEKNNLVTVDPTNQNSNDKFTVHQGGKVRHRGLELAVDGQITDRLSLSSSLMWLDARYINHYSVSGKQINDFSGKRAKDAPKFAMGAWANYQINSDNNIHLGARYEGQKFGDTSENFNKPAYTLVDLGYSHRVGVVGGNELMLRVNVNNLFNEEYLKGGCSHNAMYGEERTVKATFQLNI
ncbi:TonB-dependent receptor [Vibrio europaeus]|uniref:TonB-dependent receptor n=1 Tax=Vibrio europaeus TaxID=300876 RepID=A0AAE7B267_9VIBR|nr:TonB-dependent receptor [Vibrio europaeus]MDC5804925.1 TonB-dependent receptor [Vibrio europaeus]MDC5827000.1 TonB-dependent receptor [Vibrio europaeus]MDC5832366.1 TonB-dependent receptor [Vibrio europaeus]MDC5835321.1 TonB-dependent receptor [Vibrio europaeus]QJY39259.1 TonB-dependent receptor [Vibrio europaeus]